MGQNNTGQESQLPALDKVPLTLALHIRSLDETSDVSLTVEAQIHTHC